MCVYMFFCGEVLLVELVPAVCQTGSLYNTQFHLLLDTSFEFWQKATHQAASIEMSCYIHEWNISYIHMYMLEITFKENKEEKRFLTPDEDVPWTG